MASTDETQRLFFALWPEPALQRALAAEAREALGKRRSRRVPEENLHVTLAFLGEVGPEARVCLEEAAGDIAGEAFTLSMDRLGFRPGRNMLWAFPARTPEALERLADDLGAALEACGLERDKRPFRAHMTLARKAQRMPRQRAIDPVHWRVERFVLVASELGPQGSAYSLLREWPLAPAGTGAADHGSKEP